MIGTFVVYQLRAGLGISEPVNTYSSSRFVIVCGTIS